jgi:hypothetical protein
MYKLLQWLRAKQSALTQKKKHLKLLHTEPKKNQTTKKTSPRVETG